MYSSWQYSRNLMKHLTASSTSNPQLVFRALSCQSCLEEKAMMESAVCCQQMSQKAKHMQSEFSTACGKEAQFPSWHLPAGFVPQQVLTLLLFQATLFIIQHFVEATGRSGLSDLPQCPCCGGNVLGLPELLACCLLLYGNEQPMALALCDQFHR